MNLILSKIKEMDAAKNMQCDAVQSFFDFMNNIDVSMKIKYIHDLIKIKKMKIKEGEKYLNITFEIPF